MSRIQRQNEEDEVREIHTVPASAASSERFATMSEEFNAMVLAGGDMVALESTHSEPPVAPSSRHPAEEITLDSVKREEVESRILSWQTAKLSKINSRFKREAVDISGWEGKRVEKATAVFKRVERKMEEKRARALERMENEVAKVRQKAEEKRASAEAKRAVKVVRVLDMAKLLRAIGKAPARG